MTAGAATALLAGAAAVSEGAGGDPVVAETLFAADTGPGRGRANDRFGVSRFNIGLSKGNVAGALTGADAGESGGLGSAASSRAGSAGGGNALAPAEAAGSNAAGGPGLADVDGNASGARAALLE